MFVPLEAAFVYQVKCHAVVAVNVQANCHWPKRNVAFAALSETNFVCNRRKSCRAFVNHPWRGLQHVVPRAYGVYAKAEVFGEKDV